MKTGKELNDLFDSLRKMSKQKCSCGNKHLVAPDFHKESCEYKSEAEKAFLKFHDEPLKENTNYEESLPLQTQR